MEAKLIKTFYGYELLTQGFVKGSTNHELIDSLNIEEGNIRYKLSLKNCQAIERGYDLDELAIECMKNTINQETGGDNHKLSLMLGFQKGFQKALELMGDKKFSEEDLDNFRKFQIQEQNFSKSCLDVWLKSLQQTEWCVEIVEEDSKVVESHIWDGSNDGELTWKKQPLFDANGCLILNKRI